MHLLFFFFFPFHCHSITPSRHCVDDDDDDCKVNRLFSRSIQSNHLKETFAQSVKSQRDSWDIIACEWVWACEREREREAIVQCNEIQSSQQWWRQFFTFSFTLFVTLDWCGTRREREKQGEKGNRSTLLPQGHSVSPSSVCLTHQQDGGVFRKTHQLTGEGTIASTCGGKISDELRCPHLVRWLW